MTYSQLPSALVAVDICIFKIIDGELCVYVTNVENDNYKGKLCLPGALILLNESAEDTFKRVISNKTVLEAGKVYSEQLYTFSDIKRDKRSRVVSVSYLALYTGGVVDNFKPWNKVSTLAYDHNDILLAAVNRLRGRVEYTTIIQKLLSKDFTFSILQKAYEIVLGKEIDKRNFRKKIDSLNIITETGEYLKGGRMRPAMLYRFNTNKVENINIF
jgi:8-oxo-dGTP diphosphatase